MYKYDPKTTTWQVNEADFPRQGSSTKKLEFLLQFARLAPSSHNSQPWNFHVREDGIDLLPDMDLWLRAADPDQRELFISLGCALENLLIAAERFGYSYQIDYPEREDDPGISIQLSPEGRKGNHRDAGLFDQITKRCTNRSIYQKRKIPETAMMKLQACIYEEGFWMFATNEVPDVHFAGEELRSRIAELITRADSIQLKDPDYLKELGSWIGRGAFGDPWPVAKITQLVVTHLDIGRGQTRKDYERIMSTPVLVALASATDDRRSHILAGQIFERIALTAATLGIAVHPMSQILQVPGIKAELKQILETPEVKAGAVGLSPEAHLFPQHTFRLGYAQPAKEHTPRRPL